MRISIRRCLSMLRNTSDGNELAVPATNAYQRTIVSVVNSTGSCACVSVPRTSAWRCAGISMRRSKDAAVSPHLPLRATSRVRTPAAKAVYAAL